MARSPLPPQLPTSFSVQEAFAHGVSERRLRGGDLEKTFHGARILVEPAGIGHGDEDLFGVRAHLRRLRAYAPVLPEGAFFCGPSAALLWAIPLPPRTWRELHVAVFRPRRSPRRPGIRGHKITPGFVHVTEREGLPVTDAASTWATLGGIVSEDDLVAAADHVLRIPRFPGGFRTLTETALAPRRELVSLTERKGRPGAPALRRALELARTGASSPPETRIRLLIHRAGMPEPVLDHDVYDRHGKFLGCSELAYPDARIAIEYESDGHLTRKQLQRDIDKYQSYAEAGWRVIRLTSAHVHGDPAESVRRIRRALRTSPSPSVWR